MKQCAIAWLANSAAAARRVPDLAYVPTRPRTTLHHRDHAADLFGMIGQSTGLSPPLRNHGIHPGTLLPIGLSKRVPAEETISHQIDQRVDRQHRVLQQEAMSLQPGHRLGKGTDPGLRHNLHCAKRLGQPWMALIKLPDGICQLNQLNTPVCARWLRQSSSAIAISAARATMHPGFGHADRERNDRPRCAAKAVTVALSSPTSSAAPAICSRDRRAGRPRPRRRDSVLLASLEFGMAWF